MQFYNKILLLQIQPDLHLNGVGWCGLPSAIQQPHISRRLLQGEKKQATSLKRLSIGLIQIFYKNKKMGEAVASNYCPQKILKSNTPP
jgi:hypothetical protein